jgi:integrase/recombinase XerD
VAALDQRGRGQHPAINGKAQQQDAVAQDRHAAASRRPHALQPFMREAPGFFVPLREERGLRETSIRHYGHFLRGFERYLDRIDCCELAALSPPIVSAFVIESASRFGRTAAVQRVAGVPALSPL